MRRKEAAWWGGFDWHPEKLSSSTRGFSKIGRDVDVLHKLLEVVRLTSKTGSKALRIDLLLFRCTTVILFDPHKCKKGQETVRLAEGSESTCSLPSGHCAALAVLAPSASSNTVSPPLWETLFVPCETIFEDG
jgi:hypothetical protein